MTRGLRPLHTTARIDGKELAAYTWQQNTFAADKHAQRLGEGHSIIVRLRKAISRRDKPTACAILKALGGTL